MAKSPKKEIDDKFQDIPEFPESYHKARKQYGLYSALLMAWELLGLRLSETPLSNINFTIKSPQAAPFVLIALIVYFCFRTIIEWHQTSKKRRLQPASKIDFLISHIIASLAILLFGIQRLLQIQIANLYSLGQSLAYHIVSGLFGSFVLFVILIFLNLLIEKHEFMPLIHKLFIYLLVLIIISLTIVYFVNAIQIYPWALISFFVPILIFWALFFILSIKSSTTNK